MPDTSRFNWKDGFYSPERMEEYKASNERAAEARKAQQYGRAGGKNRAPQRRTGKPRPTRKSR